MSNEYVLISFYGIQINEMKAMLNKTLFFLYIFLNFCSGDVYFHMVEDVKIRNKTFEEINKTLAKLCWIPIAIVDVNYLCLAGISIDMARQITQK